MHADWQDVIEWGEGDVHERGTEVNVLLSKLFLVCEAYTHLAFPENMHINECLHTISQIFPRRFF